MGTSLTSFFFNDTATTEIYTLSLHDALPICRPGPDRPWRSAAARAPVGPGRPASPPAHRCRRSEEHTSELQSRQYLVCRLLLEKKKTLLSYDVWQNIPPLEMSKRLAMLFLMV